MKLCLNNRCRTPLRASYWGEGYCSERCWHNATIGDRAGDVPLKDPNDPTGEREIAHNQNEVDALIEAMAVDPRLPKIIFLRKQGKTLREVGKACELSEGAVRKILSKCARKSLRDCGLRRK